jgi:hypothetical protein
MLSPRLSLALLAALLIQPTANAQSWLAGGSINQTTQHDYSVGGPIANSNATDSGNRVFGGYMFNGWFGTVVSHVDLGTPKYSGPAFGNFTDSLKASAVDVSTLFLFTPGSEGRVSPFVSLGLFTFTQDVHYTDASGVYDYEDSGTRVSFGTGVYFKVNDVWGVHFGWQRFNHVGDKNNSGHEYTRDLYETGLEYRFGN